MKVIDIETLFTICSSKINCPDVKDSLPLKTHSIDLRFNLPFCLSVLSALRVFYKISKSLIPKITRLYSNSKWKIKDGGLRK